MLRVSIIILFAWTSCLSLHAQLYTSEIKVEDTDTKVLGNGGTTLLEGYRLYVYPGEGSSTEIRGSAVLINRNNSICGAQLQFRRQNNTDWTLKNSRDNCGTPGGFHFLNAGRDTKMTILQNGNVGIGDYNPQYKLNVNGTIAHNGALIHSDKKLKRNIQDYSAGLALLKKVKVKKYKYKAPEKTFLPNKNEDEFYDSEQNSEVPEAENAFYNREQVGVLAQDLQQVAPELVESYIDGEGEELLAINHSALTYILISALQEQQTSIELLQNEIDLLKKAKGK